MENLKQNFNNSNDMVTSNGGFPEYQFIASKRSRQQQDYIKPPFNIKIMRIGYIVLTILSLLLVPTGIIPITRYVSAFAIYVVTSELIIKKKYSFVTIMYIWLIIASASGTI